MERTWTKRQADDGQRFGKLESVRSAAPVFLCGDWEEKETLAALLRRCGCSPVHFIEDCDGQLPDTLPNDGAVICRAASAEAAGWMALSADEKGLRGAALFFWPGGDCVFTSFGGGTSSVWLSPHLAAFTQKAEENGKTRFLFETTLILYGAGAAATLLSAADRVRRALRDIPERDRDSGSATGKEGGGK